MSSSNISKNDQHKATTKKETNLIDQKNPIESSKTSSKEINSGTKTSRSKTFTDRFISENNNKKGNDIFEKWGLNADQVAEAEKLIIQLEERVDECCPIRGSNRTKKMNDK